MSFDRNRPFEAFILQSHAKRTWVFGFYTFSEFLAALPGRGSLFAGAPDWRCGRLIAVTVGIEGARASLPASRTQISRLPWPDVLPPKCELWVITPSASDENRNPSPPLDRHA
jgi:hypothetical protein